MKRKSPDLFWLVAIAVVLGALSSQLMSDSSPNMPPQQAGIMIQD